MPAEPGDPRVPARINPDVWHEEVERYAPRSPARVVAERERAGLEMRGVARRDVLRCDAEGQDGTRLPGLVKVYVPISEAPPSVRPFAFVFAPVVVEERLELLLVAFGERHPRRPTRSVYERAHKRLHSRYPDQ